MALTLLPLYLGRLHLSCSAPLLASLVESQHAVFVPLLSIFALTSSPTACLPPLAWEHTYTFVLVLLLSSHFSRVDDRMMMN